MTNIEKIKIMLEAPNGTHVSAYNTFLKDMLSQEEHFRLHDLEHDPEDLPEIGKDVLFYFSYGGDIKTRIGARTINDNFMIINDGIVSREFVKGWRELRGFEK